MLKTFLNLSPCVPFDTPEDKSLKIYVYNCNI